MQIQINKSNLYIGFASGFACTPIIAKSEKQVLLDIEDEIYRTCNWLNKKPPKDMDTFKGVVFYVSFKLCFHAFSSITDMKFCFLLL